MSAFTDRTAGWLRQAGPEVYVVARSLVWEIGRIGGPRIAVPAGFAFDFSVPRWLRWAADPHEPRYLGAACLHDWCLSEGWDRGTAAGILHDALRADGVGRARAALMTCAVIVHVSLTD